MKTSQQSLWQFSRPFLPGKRAFWLLTGLTLLATGFELAVPLLAKELVDQVSAGYVDYPVMFSLLILVIIAGATEYLTALQAGRMGLNTTKALRFRLIGHLVQVQSASLHPHHSSELAARVMTDSDELKQVFSEDLTGLISGVASFVGVIVVLVWLDWRLTLVILACLLVGTLLITPIALSMSALNRKQLQLHADLTRQTSEWFRHHDLVKVYGAREQVEQQASGALSHYVKLAMKEVRALALIGPISNLMLMVSMITLIATSAYWITQGSMTMGTFTAFLLYLFGLTFPLISMGMFFANYHKASGAAQRLEQLFSLPTEQHAADAGIDQVESIQIDSACLTLDTHPILQQFTLEPLHKGLVMICGPSGSGKTSLMRILLGLYGLNSGCVRVNGQPLRAEQVAALRKRLAWVEQQPALFQASVRDNLCLGQTDIDDNSVVQALREAGLSDWLQRIGNRLDVVLNEQNHQLSGGEKQRFALARALVRPFDVLLLDEPTSALDSANARMLMEKMTALSKTKLVLMISHNDSLLDYADKIIRLDKGSVKVQN